LAALTTLLSPAAPLHLLLTLPPPSQQDPESETARKKAEAERLRAAEKFMVIGSGTAQCKGCGYEYSPEKGDPDFPISKGVRFQVGVLWVYSMAGGWQDREDAWVCQHAGSTEAQQDTRTGVSSSGQQACQQQRCQSGERADHM
jgi:rubredoxin